MKNALRISKNKVDIMLLILLIMQPILDVLSFFMMENNMTTVTTMLRMLVFVIVALYTFVLTGNKKAYFVMAGVLGVFWILHMIGCFIEGYQSIFQDLAMYIRTIQMPVLVLCFVTVFKNGDQIPKVIRVGFFCNYITITTVILLSYLVGRPESTYQTGIGIKGWFGIGNAQSCIVALLAPLTIYLVIKAKNKLWFSITTLIVFLNMYFFGTKVTYYFIFVTIISVVFFMVLSKNRDVYVYVFLILCFCVGLSTYKYSPCYQNQNLMGASFDEWDADIAKIQERQDKDKDKDKNHKIDYNDYLEIYNLYSKDLVERFGIKNVVNKYKFSTSAKELVNNRNLKVNYCSLVMDEKNIWTHLFGYEYMNFIMGENVYDPENDFPAIYFSNGIIGLALYILFLVYFVVLIIKTLIKDFKKNLTLENGMVTITMILIIGAAQLSGNVLRRPNVSIYLSLILAYIYYLCVIKKNRENQENEKHEIEYN